MAQAERTGHAPPANESPGNAAYRDMQAMLARIQGGAR